MSQKIGRVRGTSVGAGVAGASSGTGLIALINSLPEYYGWKPLLLFAAPTVSVVVSALWLFAMAQLDAWIAEKSLNAEIKKAEASLDEIENNPNSSDKAKKAGREKVELLKLSKITMHSNRAQIIIGG